jgi:glyoxylase-like metal-dependent hydrolase (beta-lactamase superfamily II)
LGKFDILESLLKSTGKGLSDIDRVIITHSHEDHDGNLAQVLSVAKAELWAHPIYRQMISYHPNIKDGAKHPELPGSCRFCLMPEGLYRHCLPYHKARSSLTVDFTIKDNQTPLDGDINFIFTPGHAPDSICVILEDEVIFTGDTLLPDITPHPSLAQAFKANRRILPDGYNKENTVYGLMNYIKSLRKIVCLDHQSIKATFPAHRLFHHGKFNIIHSPSTRAKEVIQFHIDRCCDILRIINHEPLGTEAIAIQHFPPSQLAGMGKSMAQNEIIAHVEIMEEFGDIRRVGEDKDLAQHTGSNNFLNILKAYL